ncbi:MAG: DsrE family protein [Thermoanaerobaculia bacterium]|nr:DsrE family protein [Thermoanaerobaculia bacterium]
MTRRSPLAGLVLGALLVALLAPATPVMGQEPQKAQKVVIHLKHYSDNLHAVSMALKLGTAIQKKGGEVTLMLDLEGARLADARQPQDLRWGGETPMATFYEAFTNAGGKVLVCPHCANAAGLKEKDLRGGARIGTEDDLAQLILDADKVLDY